MESSALIEDLTFHVFLNILFFNFAWLSVPGQPATVWLFPPLVFKNFSHSLMKCRQLKKRLGPDEPQIF